MGERFESHALDGPYNAHYDRPAMLEMIGEVDGLDVLDAACGPGIYASELIARGARLRAFDGSSEMVRLARLRLGDESLVEQASLDERISYDSEEFDVVVCALAIHYAADRGATFAEFHRVLRSGGRCVVSTQHPMSDWLRKGGSYFDVRLESDVFGEWSGRQEIRYWQEPLTALCRAATSAGFLIRQLVEPLPAESMLESWPKVYGELSNAPAFITLDLVKL
jgi:ubiquinone/menaquinone biosynthesis C-methylase UbiE